MPEPLSESTFETVVETYYRPLCVFAESYVRAPDIAEEIVQDVLLWLWRRRHEVRPTGLVAYVYTAVRNRCLNQVRHQRRVDRWTTSASVDLRIAGVGQPALGPDEAVTRQEASDELWRAIGRLPERRREVVILRWLNDLSYAEIAAITGLTIKAVESTLNKAIKMLRRDLGATGAR
ncbi:MAG TPA: RNA polymerase sigma-70 factor [Gemmatimonadaceae bacterium]|nr:RNA polymerase sigma-70 factor [Gemmatimonadaceae bacterium]